MASRIWEPAEELASKLIRFGQLAIAAHVHNGKIHKLEIDFDLMDFPVVHMSRDRKLTKPDELAG